MWVRLRPPFRCVPVTGQLTRGCRSRCFFLRLRSAPNFFFGCNFSSFSCHRLAGPIALGCAPALTTVRPRHVSSIMYQSTSQDADGPSSGPACSTFLVTNCGNVCSWQVSWLTSVPMNFISVPPPHSCPWTVLDRCDLADGRRTKG